MARHILIILNPAAGLGRRRAARLRRVVAALAEHGCDVVVRETRARGDAERLARTAEPGFDLIVAAGGDGTVNEIVNGVYPASRPIAVLPLGTGNVLANEIGLPRRPADLARVIAQAPPLPIWPGRAGGRLFVAMTGVGFDAEVLGALDEQLKRRLGKLAFVWAIFRCLCRYRSREFVVCADGGAVRAASAIITKGRLYAGRFMIAPAADLADPVLHAVLFRRAGRLAALRYLGATMLGVLHHLPDVTILRARELSVAVAEPGPAKSGFAESGSAESGSAEPRLVQIDGEIAGRLPITLEIAEQPLWLVQPGAARRPGAREPHHATACFTP